jgi:hypothetical protein
MKLATNLYLVPRLKICGAISPLPIRLQDKVKVKFFLCLNKYHAMKTHADVLGSGVIASRILSLGWW